MSRTRVALDIRPFAEQDTAAVLSLLEASLGGGPAGQRSPAFFRWKHLENPFGRSYMLVAEADDRIVGFRSFMRWRFDLGGEPVRAVRAVDTATHPEYQGRGIFRQLTTTALEDLRSEAELIFNTPNDKSLPGYLKMGWRKVADLPIRVRILRPVRFLRRIRFRRDLAASETVTADSVGEPSDDVPWAAAGVIGRNGNGQRLATLRDETYLRWRYSDAPSLPYRVVVEEDVAGLRGAAIYRVRPRGRLREATVVELLVYPGDRMCASRLLRRVAHGADVDHLTCSFPPRSVQARAATRAGFLRSPEGLTLVANPLEELPVDVFSLDSWSFSLGDLEVF
jgi:GNAT superfamily N-acetyltransferase